MNGDNKLPVSVEFDDDTWEDNYLDSLIDQKKNASDEENEPDESDEDLQPPPPTIKSYSEAIKSLDDGNLWMF